MKILVIDDEELCQDLLRAMFERIGTVLMLTASLQADSCTMPTQMPTS